MINSFYIYNMVCSGFLLIALLSKKENSSISDSLNKLKNKIIEIKELFGSFYIIIILLSTITAFYLYPILFLKKVLYDKA